MEINKHKLWGITLSFALTIGAFSCKSDQTGNAGGFISSIFSSEISSDKIKQELEQTNPNNTNDSIDSINNLPRLVYELYEKNNFKPFWMEAYKLSDKGRNALKAITAIQNDGLYPEHYHLNQLQQDTSLLNDNEDAAVRFDILLTQSIAKAAKDLQYGVINPMVVDKEWHIPNDSVFNLDALLNLDSLGDKDILDCYRPQNPRYALMRKGFEKWNTLKTDSAYLSFKTELNSGNNTVIPEIIHKEINSDENDSNLIKTYQYLNHLSATGKVDEELLNVLRQQPDHYMQLLSINLERMRWLPKSFDSQYIWVSIPQAEIDYYKDGNNLFHNRTVVGSKTTRTPSLMKPLQNIVLCPPWGVPMSIIKNEYNGRIPSRYEVYKGGKRVPNSMVNSSNYRQFVVRQAPGPSAALGYVKFNLPNKWDIYLHDTPGRYVFGNKVRYLSHGCVRVKNPRDLAALILENKGVGIDSINNLIKKNRTKLIPTDTINVYIAYFTVNSDSTIHNILYLNDPYKKDEALKEEFLTKIK
ncbi:MAG TPA: L,D-transpeptidase family protein [Edaphocola sp.]|nr:L,D-transpeptidase family protein [Edaphocola sp.]